MCEKKIILLDIQYDLFCLKIHQSDKIRAETEARGAERDSFRQKMYKVKFEVIHKRQRQIF